MAAAQFACLLHAVLLIAWRSLQPTGILFYQGLLLAFAVTACQLVVLRLRRGMPEEQIEQLHVLARRFHLLPTRMDYAKALWLNGRMAEAEHELQIIRGVYHPAKFALIERDWRAWKDEHRAEAAPQPRAPAAPAASAPSSR